MEACGLSSRRFSGSPVCIRIDLASIARLRRCRKIMSRSCPRDDFLLIFARTATKSRYSQRPSAPFGDFLDTKNVPRTVSDPLTIGNGTQIERCIVDRHRTRTVLKRHEQSLKFRPKMKALKVWSCRLQMRFCKF